MGIIEKLGITKGPWGITGSHKHLIDSNETDDYKSVLFEDWKFTKDDNASPNAQLIATAPEMLEALINLCHQEELMTGHPFYDEVAIIQKATNKSWEEIKELINQ